MATRSSASVTVDPLGVSVSVGITHDGVGATAVTARNGATPISLPATISTPTTFWLPPAEYVVTVTLNSTVVAAETVQIDGAAATTVTPALDFAETAALIAAGSGASSTSTGMEIGVPTLVDSTVQIEVSSVYGIDGDDQPYYDPAGAAPGEAARLDLDASGSFFLIKPQGALAL